LSEKNGQVAGVFNGMGCKSSCEEGLQPGYQGTGVIGFSGGMRTQVRGVTA
jgi:hypothetical protein